MAADHVNAVARGESGALGRPAVVIHGGAGSFERSRAAGTLPDLEEALAEALHAGWRVLRAGGASLDAAVEAVASLEDSGQFNAGRGAVPNSEGAVELDAGVMDGRDGVAGAMAATTWPANPVRVAAELARRGGAPDGPLLLAGSGADRFAREGGFVRMEAHRLTSAAGSPHGTVGAVALDEHGRLAAATSTGGRSGQLPGRVGDSPIPGAGVWAADDTVAVSATGAGEAFVLAGFAHQVDWRMRSGSSLREAVDASLAAVAALRGEGGGIVLSADGSFAARFTSPHMARGWQGPGGPGVSIL